VQKRFSRFRRRSIIGAIVGLAFAAAAGVGLAQITAGPSSTLSAAKHPTSTSTSSSSTTTGSTTTTVGSTTTTVGTTTVGITTTTTGSTTTTTGGSTTGESSNGLGQERVAVCHKTGSTKHPSHTITIARPAVAAHIAHGDTEGECAPTTTTTAATTTTTQPTTVAATSGSSHVKKPKHEHATAHANKAHKSGSSSHGKSGQSGHGGGGGKGHGK